MSKYDTSLYYAVLHNNLDSIEKLLELGGSPNAMTEDGYTPFLYAVEHGKLEAVKRMIPGADLELKLQGNSSPLSLAANMNNLMMVNLLLENGADVNTKNYGASTPLHEAAMFGNIEMSKLLIEAGADVNAQERRGMTPLHAAAFFGQGEMAQHLINFGADPEMTDYNQNLPFQIAKNEEIAEIVHPGAFEKEMVVITAMYNGDAVQTEIPMGTPLENGLIWEDENGYIVEIEDIRELTHIGCYDLDSNEVKQDRNEGVSL